MMFIEKVILPLQKNFDKNGKEYAFRIGKHFYSYTQLLQRANAIKEVIRSIPEQYFGLMAYDDLDTYAAVLALWMEGRCYVPLHPLQPEARLENIIHQVGIQTVLNTGESKWPFLVREIDTHALSDVDDVFSFSQTLRDTDPAYILFTSGSTGTPKGVPVCFGNVAAFIDAFEDLGIHLTEKDRCLQMFDLTFDLSVGSYLPALLHGACLYTVPVGSVKYQEVFCLMDDYQLTAALMVPSVIHYLRPYMKELTDEKMHDCLFCGEALLEDDVKAWKSSVPEAKLWNVYGPTENTIYCTFYPVEDNIKNINGTVCIGKAMKNTRVAVVDEENHLLQPGEKGELCLSGSQLTPGYWHDYQNNHLAFFQDNGERWYKTGDICMIDEDGDVLYEGRKDSQVKIQGFRVELGEIENVARKFYKGRRNVVAVPVPNDQGLMTLHLVVEGGNEDAALLKSDLQNYLPTYMLPEDIRFMKEFPQNANNKIDRKAIRKKVEYKIENK